MAKVPHQKTKMENNNEENSAAAPVEGFSGELAQAFWSVITFDETAATGMTYDEAVELRKKLEAEKVSGLCIITDEAAARMNANKK